MLLADAVQPADPLLDLHRVPGQVHVHHGVAELQVAPLAGRLRADQYRHVVLEPAHRGVLGGSRQAAVVARHLDARRLQVRGELLQRRSEGGEDDHLLAVLEVAPDPLDEHLLLARPGDRPGSGGQVVPACPGQPRGQGCRTGPGEPGERAQAHQPRRRGPAALDPDPLGDVAVQLCLGFGQVHLDGLGEPLRQDQRHLAAPVPDHHLAGAGLQAFHVAHRGAPGHARGGAGAAPVLPPELRGRAEQAGGDEADELEEVVESVLDRCGGEQQQVPGAQGAG